MESIQKACKLLKEHKYKILRPHDKPMKYHEEGGYGPVGKLYYGKVIDCEANGKHHEAKPFEVGCVVFTYDDQGHIYNVVDHFTMFEDIGEPLLQDVKTITGRTDQDIEGKAFDDDKIAQVFSSKTPGIVIAHNAAYDRPKLEKRFPILQTVPWGCSYNGIPWFDCGIIDVKLRLLCMDLCGRWFDGHQAENDAHALLDVLDSELPTRNCTVFQQLLLKARSKMTRVWALDAPYEKKDILRSEGFWWDDGAYSGIKANYIDVPGDINSIGIWLEDNIYPYPLTAIMIPTATITALNNYSDRIRPSDRYVRHIMPFGQYKDYLITEVANKHADYLEWCLTGSNMELDKDLAYTFKYYLQ